MSPLDFTAVQAGRLAGCSVSQVRYWDRVELVSPTGGTPDAPRYGFRDLVALRLVRSLLDAGVPLQRIRRAAGYLQATGDDLAGLRLVTDGTTVLACRSDGEVLDALRLGQLALFVSVDAVASAVDGEIRRFREERDAFVDALHPAEGDAGSTPSP